MAFPLLSNPHKHFHTARRSPILGIVLHVTAGLEDFTPPDDGAEATVRYGQGNARPASWHGIVDSDSIIDCLPDSYTAFHVIGYNSPTLGLEIANANAKWAGKPKRWVDGTIANAAEWCRPRVEKYKLPVQLCTKAQVDAAIKAGRPFGFTYHAYLDPKNRTDPGKDFPWVQFAQLLTEHPGLRVRGPFPLPAGHWYGTDDGSLSSHSGYFAKDQAGVKQIQAESGATISGRFGTDTDRAVRKWQKSHGLNPTGRVTADVWAAYLKH